MACISLPHSDLHSLCHELAQPVSLDTIPEKVPNRMATWFGTFSRFGAVARKFDAHAPDSRL
jgi:hypothetical protein